MEGKLFGLPIKLSDDLPPQNDITFGVYVKAEQEGVQFDRKVAEVIAAVLTINLLYGDGAAEIVGIKDGAVLLVLNVRKEQRDDAIRELRKVGVVV